MATLRKEVVLFGGTNSSGYLGDTWTFDGGSWTLVDVPPAPPARQGASMATLGNEIVLFGGQSNKGDLSDTWTFDGGSWTLIDASTAPSARHSASMVPFP